MLSTRLVKLYGDIIDTDSYFLLIRGASVPAALLVQMLCIHPEIRFLMTVREGHRARERWHHCSENDHLVSRQPIRRHEMVLSIKVLFY
jgi:hypothetical protein